MGYKEIKLCRTPIPCHRHRSSVPGRLCCGHESSQKEATDEIFSQGRRSNLLCGGRRPEGAPVIALVNGVRFEVHPDEENGQLVGEINADKSNCEPPAAAPVAATGVVPSGGILDTRCVRAPIPGVILEVTVKPGQAVEYGESLFIIEAMKMRNSIRASRAGTVGEVLVSIGQTVNHNQELMTFAE